MGKASVFEASPWKAIAALFIKDALAVTWRCAPPT